MQFSHTLRCIKWHRNNERDINRRKKYEILYFLSWSFKAMFIHQYGKNGGNPKKNKNDTISRIIKKK